MSTDKTYPNLRKAATVAFCVILAAGVALRLYQFLMGRSLWEDEAHLALNFIRRDYKELKLPLDNYQSAPIQFLLTEEFFTHLFGFGEKALRLFPLICSLACLPLFYFFVLQLTKDKLASLIAFLIFSVNISLIYYSSECKPYTLDVCALTLLGYLTVSDNKFVSKWRGLLLIIAGYLASVYSNVAIIVLFCSGAYLVSQWRLGTDNNNRRTLLVEANKRHLWIFLCWIIAFLNDYLSYKYDHPYAQGMKVIWTDKFVPIDVTGWQFHDFVIHRIDDTLFTEMLWFSTHYFFKYAIAFALIAAFVQIIYTKNYKILVYTVLPILLHFVVSMFQMYPFFYRFILYLLPPFIILFSLGISAIVRVAASKLHIAAGVLAAAYFIYFSCIISIKLFPFHDREIKPVLSFMNDNYKGQKLYITTPYTLYQYYDTTGYAKDKNYTPLPWQISPQQYYDTVKASKEPYFLLYSANGFADGYGEVLKDIDAKGLVLKKFEYKTYGIMELKPYIDTTAQNKDSVRLNAAAEK